MESLVMTNERRGNSPNGALVNENAPVTANGLPSSEDVFGSSPQWSVKRSIYFIICLAGLCWLAVAAAFFTWL
jgi:hypothetical protein